MRYAVSGWRACVHGAGRMATGRGGGVSGKVCFLVAAYTRYIKRLAKAMR
jgi:hypothetical protein